MPNEYEFRVRGRLGPDIMEALHPLQAETPVTETVLRGEICDQAALHGLIARLEQFGLELLGLQRVPPRRLDARPPR
jgi:hypothetical protein